MITLTLNTGKTFEVQDSSLKGGITLFGDINLVTDALESITTETIKNAHLGDTLITDTVIENGTFSPRDEYGNYSVTFWTRPKTENEIINERLDEQDAALMELAEMIVG